MIHRSMLLISAQILCFSLVECCEVWELNLE